ncbi:MAG: hypothetical protein KJ709_03175 [Nanoarchaeota archaeon]|nr:hypothetical protein [Nanoarchaeota archaeon]
MKILLDTNVLLMPGQLGVDIVSEIGKTAAGKLYILDRSLEELDKIIIEQKGKQRDSALLAKLILEKGGITALKTENIKKGGEPPQVDALLEDYSKKGYLVATQDRGLQKKLKRYMVLRQKSHFRIMGE